MGLILFSFIIHGSESIITSYYFLFKSIFNSFGFYCYYYHDLLVDSSCCTRF